MNKRIIEKVTVPYDVEIFGKWWTAMKATINDVSVELGRDTLYDFDRDKSVLEVHMRYNPDTFMLIESMAIYHDLELTPEGETIQSRLVCTSIDWVNNEGSCIIYEDVPLGFSVRLLAESL